MALFFVGLLVFKVFSEGTSAFSRTMIKVPITFNAEKLGISNINDNDEVENADYYSLVYEQFVKNYPYSNDEEEKQIIKLLSPDYEFEVKNYF